MTNEEVLNALIYTNWADKEKACGLFLSYLRNRKDLTQEQILKNVIDVVEQR